MPSESEVIAVFKHIIELISDDIQSCYFVVGSIPVARLYLLLDLQPFKVEVIVIALSGVRLCLAHFLDSL